LALLLAAVAFASCDDASNNTSDTHSNVVPITAAEKLYALNRERDSMDPEVTLLATINLLIVAETEANTLFCQCGGDLGSGFCVASPNRCYPTPASCESDKNQELPTDAQCMVNAVNLNPNIAVAAVQCILDGALNYKNCLQQSSCSALSVDTCVKGWEQHLAVCASFPPEVETAMAQCP